LTAARRRPQLLKASRESEVARMRKPLRNALHAIVISPTRQMRKFLSHCLWIFARSWYILFGLIISAMLGNALMYGFDDLRQVLSMRPVGWLVIAALFAPGPLAHWLAIRLNR
jgi:hypothetical protein